MFNFIDFIHVTRFSDVFERNITKIYSLYHFSETTFDVVESMVHE